MLLFLVPLSVFMCAYVCVTVLCMSGVEKIHESRLLSGAKYFYTQLPSEAQSCRDNNDADTVVKLSDYI